jgi:hypothetical protein
MQDHRFEVLRLVEVLLHQLESKLQFELLLQGVALLKTFKFELLLQGVALLSVEERLKVMES